MQTHSPGSFTITYDATGYTTTESTGEEPGGIEQYDSVDEDHVENNDIAKPSVVYAKSVCNPQRGKLLYTYQ